MLVFLSNLFHQNHNHCLIFYTAFFAMSVCAFNSLPNGEYSNLFFVAAFSSKSFSAENIFASYNSYT